MRTSALWYLHNAHVCMRMHSASNGGTVTWRAKVCRDCRDFRVLRVLLWRGLTTLFQDALKSLASVVFCVCHDVSRDHDSTWSIRCRVHTRVQLVCPVSYAVSFLVSWTDFLFPSDFFHSFKQPINLPFAPATLIWPRQPWWPSPVIHKFS